jgi:hypothetical protein
MRVFLSFSFSTREKRWCVHYCSSPAPAAPDVQKLEAWFSDLASCGLARSAHLSIHHGIRRFQDPQRFWDCRIIPCLMDHWRALRSGKRAVAKNALRPVCIALILILRRHQKCMVTITHRFEAHPNSAPAYPTSVRGTKHS